MHLKRLNDEGIIEAVSLIFEINKNKGFKEAIIDLGSTPKLEDNSRVVVFMGSLFRIYYNDDDSVKLVTPLMIPLKKSGDELKIFNKSDEYLLNTLSLTGITSYGIHYIDYKIIMKLVDRGRCSQLDCRKVRELVESEDYTTNKDEYAGTRFDSVYKSLVQYKNILTNDYNVGLSSQYYSFLRDIKEKRDELALIYMKPGVKKLLDAYDTLIDGYINIKFYPGKFNVDKIINELSWIEDNPSLKESHVFGR